MKQLPLIQHKTLLNLTYVLLTVSALASSPMALAGEGHDHGDKPAAPTAGLPRFAATSDAYELVGVIDGKKITMYLDNSVTNDPVKNAKLSLELAAKPVEVKPMPDGTYEATLSEVLKPGVTAVSATFTAGAATDLLAGEIDLHDDHKADAAHGGFLESLQKRAPWLALALAALLSAGYAAQRMLRRRRSSATF